jgi:hypothetical protein
MFGQLGYGFVDEKPSRKPNDHLEYPRNRGHYFASSCTLKTILSGYAVTGI